MRDNVTFLIGFMYTYRLRAHKGYVRTRVTCAQGLRAHKDFVRTRVTCALGLPGMQGLPACAWPSMTKTCHDFSHLFQIKYHPFSGWSVMPPQVEYLVVNLVCEFWPRGVAAVIKILEKFLLL